MLIISSLYACRLKWKPPSENSIDFRLSLRFPPQKGRSSEPDFFAKPVFVLMVFNGGRDPAEEYEAYDELYVDEDEWEKYVLPVGSFWI